MRHLPRILSILALCLGVAACFTSRTPLITAEDAAFPFERLVFQPLGPSEPDTYLLEREGDAYRFSRSGHTDETALLRLREAGPGMYVVQVLFATEDNAASLLLYDVILVGDGNDDFASYAAIKPDGFVPAPGLSLCDSDVCITDLNAFVDYVRQRIESGAPSDADYRILERQ